MSNLERIAEKISEDVDYTGSATFEDAQKLIEEIGFTFDLSRDRSGPTGTRKENPSAFALMLAANLMVKIEKLEHRIEKLEQEK